MDVIQSEFGHISVASSRVQKVIDCHAKIQGSLACRLYAISIKGHTVEYSRSSNGKYFRSDHVADDIIDARGQFHYALSPATY